MTRNDNLREAAVERISQQIVAGEEGVLAEALADLRSLVLADDETSRLGSRPATFVTLNGDVKQVAPQRPVEPSQDPIRSFFEKRNADMIEALLVATTSGQTALEDRADALFTLCYISTSRSTAQGLRALELCTAACATIGESLRLDESNPSREMVLWMAFSSLFCLMGCSSPAHWEGRPATDGAGCGGVGGDSSAASACLCCTTLSSSHVPRLVVASLMEHGLWATLWGEYIARAAEASGRIGQFEAHVARLSLKLLWTLSLAFSTSALSQGAKDESDLLQHAQIVSVALGSCYAEKYDDCMRTLMVLIPRPSLSFYAASAAQSLLLHWKYAIKRSVSFREMPLSCITTAVDVFQSSVEHLIASIARRHDQTVAEVRAVGVEKATSVLDGSIHTSLLCTMVHCAEDLGASGLNVWVVASAKCSCTLQSLLGSPVFSTLLSAGVLRLHQMLLAILRRSDILPSAVDIRSSEVIATSTLVTPNVLYLDHKETMSKAAAMRVCATAAVDDTPGSPGRRRRSYLSVLCATAECGKHVEVLSLQRSPQTPCSSGHDERARLMTFSFDNTSPANPDLTPTLQLSDQVQDVVAVVAGVPLDAAPLTSERLCLRAEAQLSLFSSLLAGGALVAAAATRASEIEVWMQQSQSVAGESPRNAFDRRRAAAQRTRHSPPPVPPRFQGFVRAHSVASARPNNSSDASLTSTIFDMTSTTIGPAKDAPSPPPREPTIVLPNDATTSPPSGRQSASEVRLDELVSAHGASLALKDSEIAFLKEEVEQLSALRASDAQRIATVERQRDDLLAVTTDLRSEVSLCHEDVIGPLRAEVSRLRQHLAEREKQLSEALRAGRKLELENSELYSMLGDAHTTVEELSAAARGVVTSA